VEANRNLLCAKCSHIGPPHQEIVTIKGAGNKKLSKCAKCGHVLAIEDFIRNKAEKSPDAPTLF